MSDLIDRQPSQKNDSNAFNLLDCVRRQETIDAMLAEVDDVDKPNVELRWWNMGLTRASEILKQMPSVQPEITDEQAIEHLQSTGWMQNHDREMYDMGLKKQLADDSGSYDSLLPSAQPEIIRCKDCKHRYIEDMIWHCPFGLMGGEDFFCGYGSFGNTERKIYG